MPGIRFIHAQAEQRAAQRNPTAGIQDSTANFNCRLPSGRLVRLADMAGQTARDRDNTIGAGVREGCNTPGGQGLW